MRDLFDLMRVFVPFSLLSIGGGTAIFAGIQHESVAVHGWLTPAQFIDMFAISRASPGPGTMIVALIGWKVAGWAGAIVATLSLFVPSSVLCFATIKLTNRYRAKKWHRAVREGLAPVGIGLTIAGALSIFQLSGGRFVAGLFAIAALALLTWIPRFPIVVVLLLAGVAGALIGEHALHL